MLETDSTQKRIIRKYATLGTCFAAISVGLLLLSRRYVIDRSEYYPIAYLIVVAGAGAFLIRLVLNDLRRVGKLRGIFLAIAERGFVAALIQRSMRRERPARGPLLRLSILAGVIFLLVWVLAWNDILFDQNLRLAEQCDWMGHGRPDETVLLRQLHVMTQGRGTEERLNLMLRVTKNLVDAGAKVVVLELPKTVSRPYYNDLVTQIQSTGKVVFAVQNDYYLSQPLSWSTRKYYGPWTTPDTLIRSWGLITGEWGQIPRSHRAIYYVPDDYVHSFRFESDTIPDVTIEILRHWRDYPREVKPVHAGRELVFGDYRIPLSASGLAISPARFVPQGYLTSIAVDDGMTGKFDYRWFDQGVERSAEDLMEFEQAIRGMIIIVTWSDPVENRISPFNAGLYASTMILNDALHERFVAVRDDIHIPATIIVLFAGVVLILRFRPLLSIPLLVLLGGLMLFGSAWLFGEKLILVEVIYPLAGLGLCILLLPLAKISADVQREP